MNNATLSVEQGTVLACQGWPYPWGIRLNPGGRLNVNGLPTNRVVFAHLEAVQESPVWDLEPWGPTITWKELYLWNGPPAPFPEAKFQYTDFPTFSGAWNGHFDASSDYLSSTYSLVANLELDGCHLQGGWFVYDDGGPAGRTVSLRNTVFDRCAVVIHHTSFYEDYMGVPSYSARVTAVNNLFYQCFMLLSPVAGDGAGASWTFTDNLSDNVFFDPNDNVSCLNGPVGVNHHNAYVGMSSMPNGGGRLAPPAPTSTDPDLAALNYQTGPLGSFYLPSTATNLLARGSRLAGAAGEYHFACLTNNQKEATGQVGIGPHYLALVTGGAPDANGNGVPDFLADRNGDGIEGADEIPWQTTPAGLLAILYPADGSTVAGLIPVRFGLGTNATADAWVALLVDGASQLCSSGGGSPADSTAELEADTTYLANGQHTLALRANYA